MTNAEGLGETSPPAGSPSTPLGATGDARALPDFADTEQTFRHLSSGELRQASWLFALMGKPWLTRLLSSAGALAVRWRLPGAVWCVRKTIYRQFVGGTDLQDALPTIERLFERGVTSILDYGVEAKSEESDFDNLVTKVQRAIRFGSEAPAAGSVVVKVTGIAPNDVLESLNETTIDFSGDLDPRFRSVIARLDTVCEVARDRGVQVYLDAEESWFQNTIDQLADEMMRRYNTERVVVLNTYQLYRHDRLAFLKSSFERAESGGYLLGTKLVRGAYMDKERARATERGIGSPIQPDIESTHRDFDAAVRFCLQRIESICCTIGTHNEASTRKAAAFLDEQNIPRNHEHVRFAQLLGMSDNLTFNLAEAGFNASKYLVYGPVNEVLPYLVRRAQENTSVTGEMGRELRLLNSERRRRRHAPSR